MVLYEFITASTGHNYEDGEYTDSVNKEGNYLNMIQVYCFDCNLEKVYSRRNLPKWVDERLKQVSERDLS
jgi:hypothetical protein